MNADAVLRELEGMRALARALVHDSAHADDLMQDAAVAALEKPPVADVPPRAWLMGVLRNRRRMDARAEARRAAREVQVGALADETERPEATLDRARATEPYGYKRLRSILVNRILMQGLLVFDYRDRYGEALEGLSRLLADGKLKYRESIVEGLDNAPAGLIALLAGGNFGKQVVRL